MKRFINTLKNIWNIKDLRDRILYTLALVLIYRVGSYVVIPGINPADLAGLQEQTKDGVLGLLNMFSGGAFSNASIFALGIMPYITASIIVQLLTIAFPYFQRLAQEGNEGRKKMAQITRYMTVVLGLIQAIGLTVGLFSRAVVDKSAFSIITMVLVLTAGTAFLMWLGEQINEKGVGNGISADSADLGLGAIGGTGGRSVCVGGVFVAGCGDSGYAICLFLSTFKALDGLRALLGTSGIGDNCVVIVTQLLNENSAANGTFLCIKEDLFFK